MKSKNFRTLRKLAVFGMFLLATASAASAEEEVYEVIIKDHRFVPAEVVLPSDKKVKLVVSNQDSTPEEFESYDLNREKVVTANGKITLFIGPLKPGEYKFFGEFHQETAQGKVVVR